MPEIVPISEIDSVDFSKEASVPVHLTIEDGTLVFEDGQDAEEFARAFSLMKFGHMPSVRVMALMLANHAVEDPKFIEFVTQNPGQLYICSPGIYNIPSASNLLLQETAKRINAFLSLHGYPTMIIKPLTRVGESSLNYAESSIADRGASKSSTTLMPSEFKGNPVLYLDDICITGTVLNRNKERLLTEAEVGGLFFLVAAQMDPEIVASTDGKIEDKLNRHVVDGSLLGGFIDVLEDEFVVVQKTLKVILDPENLDDLQNNLEEIIGTQRYLFVLLQVYTAATSNDFWHRYKGKYQPALTFIFHTLQAAGILNQNGIPTV